MRNQPDGTRSVQWGTASNADTTTGTTGATPLPKPQQKDSTSASVAGQSFSAFGKDQPSGRSMQDWITATAKAAGIPLSTYNPPSLPPSQTVGEAGVHAFKQGYLVRITDGELATADVWPVEVLSSEEMELSRKVAREQERRRVAGITAKLALAHTALHPIIELHSPNEYGECSGCDGGPDYSGDWPCRTIELILEGLGG